MELNGNRFPTRRKSSKLNNVCPRSPVDYFSHVLIGGIKKKGLSSEENIKFDGSGQSRSVPKFQEFSRL